MATATEERKEWLKATAEGALGVDRQQNAILGYVVAEAGPFKTPGRGEFTLESLQRIVELGNQAPLGLKSRFTHPDLSSDGLGKFLGRARSFRLDGTKVRADLYFDRTALKEPPQGGRPLGTYLLDLADSDPAALSSSLVLRADRKFRRNEDGTLQEDEDGRVLPPIWMPTELHASDIVDTGDAVHGGLLSADLSVEGLPDGVVRRAAALLDEQFGGRDRDFVLNHCSDFLARYLAYKFPEDDDGGPDMPDTKTNEALQQLAETNKQVLSGLSGITDLLKKQHEAQEKALADKAEKETQPDPAEKVKALCKMAGVDDDETAVLAEKVKGELLSIDDVREHLKKKFFASRELPAGDTSGGEDKASENELRREYRLHTKVHSALGISEQDYVKFGQQQRLEAQGVPAVDYLGEAQERSAKAFEKLGVTSVSR